MLETWSTNPNSRHSSSKRAGLPIIQIVHQIHFRFTTRCKLGRPSRRTEFRHCLNPFFPTLKRAPLDFSVA